MNTLKTKGGLIFTILWIGTSYDGSLRFEIVSDMSKEELREIFADKNQTETLTHRFDERETVYEGYTSLESILMVRHAIVTMVKP